MTLSNTYVIYTSDHGESFADLLLHPQTAIALRSYLHGECRISKVRFNGYEGQETKNNISYEDGAHYIIDGCMKYIWFNQSGREQLFNIEDDYEELNDLSQDIHYQDVLQKIRQELIEELKKEDTNLTDGNILICNTEPSLHSQMEAVMYQRLSEGKRVAYYATVKFQLPDKKE